MAIGSSKSPTIAEAVKKASGFFEGRKIVSALPREPAKRFSNRARPQPAAAPAQPPEPSSDE